MRKEYTVVGIHELNQVAEFIFKSIDEYKIICFSGPMGSGKTTLIKEVLKMAEVKDNVSSPTFSLVNEYKGSEGRIFYHFDFYRINDVNEAYDIGAEEYFYSGNSCLIEWSDKVEEILPSKVLKVNIEVLSEAERKIEIVSS